LDELTHQLSAAKTGISYQETARSSADNLTLGPSSNSEFGDMDHQAALRKANSSVPNPHKAAEMEDLIFYAKQLVGNIQTCAEHQARIANNVLDLTRLDAGKIEPLFDVVDVQALGQQTVTMMSSKAQHKQVDLSMRGKSTQPLYLKADATILRQVLLNLISNAIKVRHSWCERI
jgi:signal transduction histidine kinase